MATLQAEFTAHLLHEAPERNAFLKQHAPNVRGLATFGPMAVDVAGCVLGMFLLAFTTGAVS